MADKDIEICAYCTEYDTDNYYCPHKGEMYPEDTCDGWTGEEETGVGAVK